MSFSKYSRAEEFSARKYFLTKLATATIGGIHQKLKN
jgi:hypothetical protein